MGIKCVKAEEPIPIEEPIFLYHNMIKMKLSPLRQVDHSLRREFTSNEKNRKTQEQSPLKNDNERV